MAKVGLQRASELTGKSRSTIHRAMEKGRLSYEKGDTGERLVDVSELERVFGISASGSVSDGDAPMDQRHDVRLVELMAQLTYERAKNALQAERIEELKAREQDLREERDKWRFQAERLLMDQRSPQPHRSIFGWFGRARRSHGS